MTCWWPRTGRCTGPRRPAGMRWPEAGPHGPGVTSHETRTWARAGVARDEAERYDVFLDSDSPHLRHATHDSRLSIMTGPTWSAKQPGPPQPGRSPAADAIPDPWGVRRAENLLTSLEG